MDPATRTALGRSQLVDLTTVGRRSGEPRTIEIYLHNLEGRLIISGVPHPGRTRAWIHNVAANPAVALHLKDGVSVDLPATARVVTDPDERRELLAGVARNWRRTDLDVMQLHSPLIELSVEGYPT
jgi:deazaflavin-dependent oxidoreductase (nitroreductase family)